MKQFALNFICKNESHVIRRMLNSTKPITDLIVAIDTGSTDKTMAIIREHGTKHNIPTYVFERPFDNFCNSRNYALNRLKEVVESLSWDPNSTWGFWIDCDETMHIERNFDKETISYDYHYVPCVEGESRHIKSLFFRLSLNWTWVNPIHEHLACKGQNLSNSTIESIHIQYERKGASWNGNLETKFLNYVAMLNDYVSEENRSFPWLCDMAESYHAAADECRPKNRKKTLLMKSVKYYKEAIGMNTGTRDQRYSLFRKIAMATLSLKEDWSNIRETLLTAYATDKRHAEPFFDILKHYMKTNQWQIAYLYSSFALSNYHDRMPKDKDITSQVIVSLYNWKLLLFHSIISVRSGRIEQGKSAYSELSGIVERQPDSFKKKELNLIHMNSPTIILGIPKIHALILKGLLN